ncbi:MAG: hypothetical protein U0744_12910 [Gemmataceae bacterium]
MSSTVGLSLYGGPERQMLGLARHLPSEVREARSSRSPKVANARRCSAKPQMRLRGQALTHNFPYIGKAVAELADELKRLDADVLTLQRIQARHPRLAGRACR